MESKRGHQISDNDEKKDRRGHTDNLVELLPVIEDKSIDLGICCLVDYALILHHMVR